MKATSQFTILLMVLATACGGSGAGKGAKGANDESGSSGNGAGGDTSAEPETSGGGEPAAGAKIHAPATGTKWLERRAASLDYELTLTKDKAAGGMQAGSWSLDEERSYEVLASDGAKITKLRVVFGKREAKPLLGVELTAATAGHGYVIEVKGGSPTVTRVDGKDVSTEERDALMAEYDWVGGANPLVKWLQGGSLPEGKSVEGGSAETRALLGMLDGMDYTNAKIKATSKGKEGSKLSLDVNVSVRLTSDQTFFDLELHGPASVDLDKGSVSDMTLSGTAKASGHLKHKKGLLTVAGKGNASLKLSSESH
jgi:hypothetical protein